MPVKKKLKLNELFHKSIIEGHLDVITLSRMAIFYYPPYASISKSKFGLSSINILKSEAYSNPCMSTYRIICMSFFFQRKQKLSNSKICIKN